MSDDKKKTDDGPVDEELNDLLDSALEDFDKSPKAVDKDQGPALSSAQQAIEDVVEDLTADENWSQDFIKQQTEHFQKNFQNLIKDRPELESSWHEMAQTVANAIDTTSNEDGKVDFQAAISEALKDLSSTSENLQNAVPGISEADLAAMFSQANLDDDGGDILPFMQDVMQSILSKEILYPSFKEIVDKYPAWLEENKTALPAADLQRYIKQNELMQKVCTEFEKEKEGDSDDAKKQRFDTVLSLMQEMEGYGQPPEELVGKTPSLVQFDNDGNPVMPALPPGVEPPQNCSIM